MTGTPQQQRRGRDAVAHAGRPQRFGSARRDGGSPGLRKPVSWRVRQRCRGRSRRLSQTKAPAVSCGGRRPTSSGPRSKGRCLTLAQREEIALGPGSAMTPSGPSRTSSVGHRRPCRGRCATSPRYRKSILRVGSHHPSSQGTRNALLSRAYWSPILGHKRIQRS